MKRTGASTSSKWEKLNRNEVEINVSCLKGKANDGKRKKKALEITEMKFSFTVVIILICVCSWPSNGISDYYLVTVIIILPQLQ